MKKYLIPGLVALLLIGCNGPEQANSDNNSSAKIQFGDKTAESKIDFEHFGGKSKNKWLPEVMGGGVAAIDVNNDDNIDLIFVGSGDYDKGERTENGKTRLFINKGNAVFEDATEKWNLTSVGYGQGIAVGDFDNDGNTDIFLTNLEGNNRLLRNTGDSFEDVTEASGIKEDGKWATSAGFGDFDNDGDLDIFIVRYIEYSKETHKPTFNNKMLTYSAPYLYPGVKDQILRNEGDGKFVDASEEFGISKGRAEKGLALAIGDIDLDGDSDVYVANDTTPNQLWINEDGKFVEKAALSGSAYSETGREEGSMGADFSDFDNNGFQDIVVTNFQAETTAVYSQKSALLFQQVADAIGVGETARSRLSFGIDFFDADNDGDEDLFVANGHIDDTVDVNSDSITFAQQNTLYENDGTGSFADISDGAGSGFQLKNVSRGTAVADFNNDGKLDVAIANNNSKAVILLNESGETGNSVTLELIGDESNKSAIGALVKFKHGDKTQVRQVFGANSYLAVPDFRIHLGIGKKVSISDVEIVWPNGKKQTLGKLESGKFYRVNEGKNAEVISE